MNNVQDRIDLFVKLMACDVDMALTRYDHTLARPRTPDGATEPIHQLFTASLEPASLSRLRDDPHKPMLLFGRLSTLWGIVPEDDTDDGGYCVIGPCIISDMTEYDLAKDLAEMTDDLAVQRRIRNLLVRTPVSSVNNMQVFVRQLYLLLHDREVPVDDLLRVGHGVEEILTALHSSETPSLPHNPHLLEERIFNAIEQGQILTPLESAFSVNGYAYMPQVGDTLRQYKTMALISDVLASRAAIRGGVPAMHAYAISDMYVRLIEEQTNIGKLMEITPRILSTYAQIVREYQEETYSVMTKDAISFIRINILEQISLEQVAKELGYNKNYLSTVFRKETGKTVGEFITEYKIRQAKSLLELGELSCAEISHKIGYSSESYFSKVFRKETGMTPTEYARSL